MAILRIFRMPAIVRIWTIFVGKRTIGDCNHWLLGIG